MGEDFLRRRNDRFVRQREICFVSQTRADLFSCVPPTTILSVCGTALGPVNEAQELWTPNLGAGAAIEFFAGDIAVVRVEGSAAAQLRAEHRDSRTPLIAQVTEVEHDFGLVVLRVGSAA